MAMPSHDVPAVRRSEFNFTTFSTLHHLIAVGVVCAGLWAIIAATFGV